MKRLGRVGAFFFGLACLAAKLPNGEAQGRDPKNIWESCETSRDCVVIDVGGCIGTRAIARKSEAEYREWAAEENPRRNCIEDPRMEEIPVERLTARCEERRCIMEEKE